MTKSKYDYTIHFSKGIDSKEIEEYLVKIQEQINRYRLYTGGAGIIFGFDIDIKNDFEIFVHNGGIINTKGEEYLVDSEKINFELPKLLQIKEENLKVQEDGSIRLGKIPYSSTKKHSINNTDIQKRDIIVLYESTNMTIPIKYVNDNVIYINNKYSSSNVTVIYQHIKSIIYTIYIDCNDYKIKYFKGTPATAPSIYETNNKILIGFILYNPHVEIEKGIYEARIYEILKHLKQIRPLYVDNDFNLYIHGVKYKDLALIFKDKPKDPILNSFYYDNNENVFKVYKEINNILDWYPVGNSKYTFRIETKIWYPKDNPKDLQTFLFTEEEQNMYFMPNTNQLFVTIDQTPLMSDQFEEIIEPNIKERFENSGRGFKLASPLDRKTVVQAMVFHTVNTNPINRFEKTNTFQKSNLVKLTEIENNIFNVNPYKVDNSQIALYLNGKKLINKKHYLEGPDIIEEDKKNKYSNQIQLLIDIDTNKDELEYITTVNICSYNDLYEIITKLDKGVISNLDKIEESIIRIKNLYDMSAANLSEIDTIINEYQYVVNKKLESYEKNIKDMFVPIETSFSKDGLVNELNVNINNKSFLSVYYEKENVYYKLMNKKDFTIKEDNKKTYFVFTEPCKIEDNTTIYIEGICF